MGTEESQLGLPFPSRKGVKPSNYPEVESDSGTVHDLVDVFTQDLHIVASPRVSFADLYEGMNVVFIHPKTGRWCMGKVYFDDPSEKNPRASAESGYWYVTDAKTRIEKFSFDSHSFDRFGMRGVS